MAAPTKRQRKANFTESETTKLMEMVDRHITTINQQGSTLTANARKKQVWQEIAQEVSSTSFIQRGADECRKKWRDLKRAVTAYRAHSRGTGGGPPLPEPPFYQWASKILGDSDALEGIQVCIPDPWDTTQEVTILTSNGDGSYSSTLCKREHSELETFEICLPVAERSPSNAQPSRVKPASPIPQADIILAGSMGSLTVPSTSSKCQHMAKNIATAFGKGKAKKQLAAEGGDPQLWDEWLKVQIDYYKTFKRAFKKYQRGNFPK